MLPLRGKPLGPEALASAMTCSTRLFPDKSNAVNQVNFFTNSRDNSRAIPVGVVVNRTAEESEEFIETMTVGMELGFPAEVPFSDETGCVARILE